jgi:NADPH-dependent glutamate synthase beta subunit-like oxidoreductase
MLCSKVFKRVVGHINASAIRPAAVRCVAMSAGGTRRVAVVGGGVSGLHCAYVLSKQGHAVTVFDMGKFAPGK